MKSQNSKITVEYKAEITDILSRISQNLEKSVTETIAPKITDFTTSLENNFRSTQEINKEQKANIKKTSSFINTLDDKVLVFSKMLGELDIVDKISTSVKGVEKKIIHENKSNKDEIIHEISKGNTQLLELISQQKKVEIILQNLDKINFQQSELLESLNKNGTLSNESLNKIKVSIALSNETIENEKLILNNAITVNNKLIDKTAEKTEASIISQLVNFTSKISDINNIQLKETKAKQERTDKIMYLLLFIVSITLVLSLVSLFK